MPPAPLDDPRARESSYTHVIGSHVCTRAIQSNGAGTQTSGRATTRRSSEARKRGRFQDAINIRLCDMFFRRLRGKSGIAARTTAKRLIALPQSLNGAIKESGD